jgi:bacteriocin-like protein
LVLRELCNNAPNSIRLKTLMNAKYLNFRPVKHVSCFTVQDLSTDLVELSEKDLKQISGGFGARCTCGGGTVTTTGGTTTTTIDGTTTNKGGKTVTKPCTCKVIKAGYSITLKDDSTGMFDSIFP